VEEKEERERERERGERKGTFNPAAAAARLLGD
jgi:hypothetical protein